jgi:carbonic anhydrase
MNKMASLSYDMEPGARKALGVVYPKNIKLGSKKYHRYIGSLTTPPCTKGLVGSF